MASIDLDPSGEEPKSNIPIVVGDSGLLPLTRLTSDDRLARIRPETLAQTEFEFNSVFARDFVRSNFNFAAAKMTLARGGKLIAIEAEFRVAEAYFKSALAWANKLRGRSVVTYPETVTLEIKHAMSGRLVRLITLYDQLFLKTREALLTGAVSPENREKTLDAAQTRLKHIPFLCSFENDRFAPEGVLLPDPEETH